MARTLWEIQKTMERSTIFNREVNEQNGQFSIDFNSYVKLPESIR
jgi:hypothetical protein